MSRWVEPRRAGLTAADAHEPASGPAERIVKYIPAEVLVGYTGLIALLGTLGVIGEQQSVFAACLMAGCLIATVVLVWNGAPEQDGVRRAHLIVSPVAFLAWSYSISACLLGGWFLPEIAFSLVAVAVTLSIILVPKVY